MYIFKIDGNTGRLGNQLIRYAVISNILQNSPYKIKEIYIDNKLLPLKYTNLNYNELENQYSQIINITNEQIFNIPNLIGNYIININGYFQKFKYFNNNNVRELMYNAFDKLQNIEIKNELVIHIRAGDQWVHNKYPNYIPHSFQNVVPIKFYKKIIEDNKNLQVRFVCETLNDKFIDCIKKCYPNAIFQSSTLLNDFNTLLGAKKLVLSVSTLAFCAGWLNKNADEIIIPQDGFFHHNCATNDPEKIDLFINETRYKYVEIEPNYPYISWKGDENDFNRITKFE